MDDSCAVCAETLEWVAYGPCGHREVCSTCVARLRFICDDRRCCICKSESHSVFVTKVSFLSFYILLFSFFLLLSSQLLLSRCSLIAPLELFYVPSYLLLELTSIYPLHCLLYHGLFKLLFLRIKKKKLY